MKEKLAASLVEPYRVMDLLIPYLIQNNPCTLINSQKALICYNAR